MIVKRALIVYSLAFASEVRESALRKMDSSDDVSQGGDRRLAMTLFVWKSRQELGFQMLRISPLRRTQLARQIRGRRDSYGDDRTR